MILTQPLKKAVYGVLPKNNMRKVMMGRLFLFPGEDHPYEANRFIDYEPENTPATCIGSLSKNSK